LKAKRERDDREDESTDHRLKPQHMFRDIGPAVEQADYRPRTSENPEQILATAFIEMKRDYGGPLPAARC